MQYKEYRGIIFRRTYPRLEELIARSHKWFHGFAKWTGQNKTWTFPSGATLKFAHCQNEEDKWDYNGQEYQFVGFDEITEFTQSQYDFLKVQGRSTNPDIPVRIRCTGNPGNIGHTWVKQRFIDNKVPKKIYVDTLGLTSMFIPAKVYDNPSIITNDPTYVKRLESLPDTERKAFLDGDWNIFAGQYFREWNQSYHVIDNFKFNAAHKHFIAGDYGFKNPSAVGWYEVDYDGRITLYKEIYLEGLLYDELAKKILDYSEGEEIDYAVFDPAIWGDVEHHKRDRVEGKSGAEIMMDVFAGKIALHKGDNRRLAGWANVRQYLKERKFRVTRNCVHFLRTFPALIHDQRKPEDLDTMGEDHLADQLRYALMSRPNRPEEESKPLPRYCVDRLQAQMAMQSKNKFF